MKKCIMIILGLICCFVIAFGVGRFLLKGIKNTPNENLSVNTEKFLKKINYEEEIKREREKIEIKNIFPADVKEIAINNYNTTNVEPIKTILSSNEQIYNFMKLLNSTYWEEVDIPQLEKYKPIVDISINGKNTSIVLNMYAVNETDGELMINTENENKSYYISKRIFQDIVYYNYPKYYLHRSSLETPDKTKCLEAQKLAFDKLSDNEILTMKKAVGIAHSELESLLVNSIRTLKESTSPYWNTYITGQEMKDLISGEVFLFGDEYCFNYTLNSIKNITKIIRNEKVLNDLNLYINTLQEGIDNHDLAKCFAAHEIIHDYDVWIIEYPIQNLKIEPIDWSGLNVYFGKNHLIQQ